MFGYIYKITNLINNKIYIGKTLKDVYSRFAEHIRTSRNEDCENRPLYKAMKKYGVENFKVEEIEKVAVTDGHELNEREIYWIAYYNSYENGYNATLGGDGKSYLDYEKIAKTYQEIQNINKTCEICDCTHKTVQKVLKAYNIEIKKHTEVIKKDVGKTVMQLSKAGELIKIFNSCHEASVAMCGNIKGHSHISDCAKGKRNSAYGYLWAFAN